MFGTIKNRKFTIFLFLFLGGYFVLSAQDFLPALPQKIRHISSTDGLSQVSIRTILKDSKGFVWLGTIDGLNRFDGTNIVRFYHNPKDKNSLCGNFINTLCEDDKGRIWIGTTNRGFCYYDPKHNNFVKPHFNSYFNKLIESSVVTNIQKDTTGAIWISANTMDVNRGLIRIRETTAAHFEIDTIPVSNNEISITDIYIDTGQKLWVGTASGEVFYAGIQDKEVHFHKLDNFKSDSRINCFIDDTKNLWIGGNNGFWCLNKEDNSFSFFDLNTSGTRKTRKYFVYALVFTSPLELWVGAGNGLYRLRREDPDSSFHKLALYQHENNHIISHNTVYSLWADGKILWIGTARNLDIFSFYPSKFNNITDQLSNRIVLSIYKNKHDLWVGTAGGLHLFRNGKKYLFKEDASDKNSISDNIVKSIVYDHQGYLWLGSTKGISAVHLKTFNPDKPVFIPVRDRKEPNENVTQLFVDRQNQMWVCTKGQGIKRFTGNLAKHRYTYQYFKHLPNNSQTISSNTVYCMAQDTASNYWLGSLDGLEQLTFTDTSYTAYRINKFAHHPDNPHSISSNSVKNIYIDKNGILWIGTRFGFNKFNPKDKLFKTYYTTDGLPNNLIYAIQEDQSNHLWLATNKGLSCFDKLDKRFINFFTKDGLPDNEFNSLSNFKDSQDQIYFGTVGGLTAFNPDTILQSSEKHTVLISEIQKPESRASQAKSGNIAMTYLNPFSGKPLKLAYRDFPVFMKFASPQSGPFDTPDYYYKLLPIDKDWTYLGNRKELQLLNLAPDSYTLLLAGGQNGKVWADKTFQLTLQVAPPWWRTNGAYIAYLMLFMALVYGYYRFYFKRKMAQKEADRLREIDELKTKLFNNITHELRTPLTVIMGMTANIIDELSPEQLVKLKSKFDILSKNNKKLLFLINQILDLSKIESGKMQLHPIQDDIIPFLRLNVESFHSLAKHKKIDLIFYDEIKSLQMDFDPEIMTIIISNLISNAIKFTGQEGKIILHANKGLVAGTPCLILKVKDNGIGISKEDLPHIFDRFYQADIHLLTDGTGIGLSLTKEVVTMMNGQITVRSALRAGTEFIVSIPVTNQAQLKSISLQPDSVDHKTDEQQAIDAIADYEADVPLLLVVEDNHDMAHYIASCLQDNYHIIFAYDGQQGVDMAFDKVPDIIITDLMMPVIDGLKLTAIIKNDIRTSHIPVIMLTARSLEEDRLSGLKQGADAYLIKPFNKQELRIRVEQLILLRKKLQQVYASNSAMQTLGKKQQDKEAVFVSRIIKIIQEELSNPHINAFYISDKLAMSESQLYRKLKAITGKSTAIFIRRVRLQEAKKMLQTTDKNISEIAYDCGFNNPAWFSNIFKEQYGVSPSSYRN